MARKGRANLMTRTELFREYGIIDRPLMCAPLAGFDILRAQPMVDPPSSPQSATASVAQSG
jgi:hypothetical protein